MCSHENWGKFLLCYKRWLSCPWRGSCWGYGFCYVSRSTTTYLDSISIFSDQWHRKWLQVSHDFETKFDFLPHTRRHFEPQLQVPHWDYHPRWLPTYSFYIYALLHLVNGRKIKETISELSVNGLATHDTFLSICKLSCFRKIAELELTINTIDKTNKHQKHR